MEDDTGMGRLCGHVRKDMIFYRFLESKEERFTQ